MSDRIAIDTSDLPPEEFLAAQHLGHSLSDLGLYIEDFEAAIHLFDFCLWQEHLAEQRPPKERDYAKLQIFGQWQFLAARDGAMTIYHFAKAMEGIRASFGPCPVLRSKVDHLSLRAATKKLRESFPRLEALRHAVAHTAELTADEEAFRQNSFSGTYKGPSFRIESAMHVMIQRGLQDRLYTTTYEGKILSYELSGISLEILKAVRDEFCAGFKGAIRPEPNAPKAQSAPP